MSGNNDRRSIRRTLSARSILTTAALALATGLGAAAFAGDAQPPGCNSSSIGMGLTERMLRRSPQLSR